MHGNGTINSAYGGNVGLLVDSDGITGYHNKYATKIPEFITMKPKIKSQI